MLRRRLALLIISSLSLACTDSAGPAPDMVGTWRLQTVNGTALPFSFQDSPVDRIEIISNVLTFADTGRFMDVNLWRVTDGSIVRSETINAQGTYTFDGSTVTLTYDGDGAVYTATVLSNIMTLHDSEIALTFVYGRD